MCSITRRGTLGNSDAWASAFGQIARAAYRTLSLLTVRRDAKVNNILFTLATHLWHWQHMSLIVVTRRAD